MIDERRAYTYFKNRFVLKNSTNGWTIFDCPFCIKGEGKKKAAFNLDREQVKCWVCGWKNTIVDFVMEREGKSYFDAKEFIHAQKPSAIDLEDLQSVVRVRRVSDIKLPHGYNHITDGTGIIGKRARNYLLDRGFTMEYLDRVGFGYCNEHHKEKDEDYYGYIIIPFKNIGVLRYYIGRDFMGNFLRYKNPPVELFGVGKNEIIFNEDALELKRTVFISEGWSDAATMGDAGTATLGWKLSNEQKSKYMSSSAKNFIFIPDRGEHKGVTYYQKAVRAAMDFMEYKDCKVVNLDLIPEKYGKDANEIGYDRIMEQVEKSPILTDGVALEAMMV